MKKSTIYVIVVVLLLVILAVYIAKRLVKTDAEEYQAEIPQSNGGSSSGTSYDETLTQNATFPLKLTSPNKKGLNVRQLQRWLNEKLPNIYIKLDIDGIFGTKTEQALYSVTGKKEMNLLEFNANEIYNELSI